MGTYRLLLAFAVLYSHAFGTVFGINPGVVAVISFFVISGYVMTLLFERYYRHPVDILGFYCDRALRLYPQFLAYMSASIVLWYWFDLSESIRSDLSFWNILASYTIIPLNYYMYWTTLPAFMPQAWSLGLELAFYIFVPFYLISATCLRLTIFAISLGVALIALTNLINTDFFGYRLLPGTFFIFAVGASMASARVDRWLPLATFLIAAIAFVASILWIPLPYNTEVYLGLLLGVPIVWVLRGTNFDRWDAFLGNLSYGVFLNHFIVIWLCDYFGLWTPVWVPFGSAGLAFLSYSLFERPAMLARYAARRRRVDAAVAVADARPLCTTER